MVNFGLIILGILIYNILAFGIGLYRFISTISGGPDDVIGNYSVTFDHDDLATVNPGGAIPFSSNDLPEDGGQYEDPIESGGNDWALE